jgi:hypothetical protein
VKIGEWEVYEYGPGVDCLKYIVMVYDFDDIYYEIS